ncbi:hypothetical protein GCM10010275_18800 [Streptomyces litmocidini]|uniref:DUF6153 family protein n=1 Tax=Streptomyces litmocidini TaxID=67318 RepID=UPI00167E1355|nr:DUF6153 family protein [Streptomyces litmocidini]GGU83781.1 hypothetical protein GCM10010275_18800 [Streptomyces litmocidini]
MRTHRAEHGERAGGAVGHLLLVVVLALGVFLMHTVGHPEGSGGDMSTSTDAVSGPHHGSPAYAPASHDGAPHAGGGSDARHEPGTGTGTDMTTLCVAVLGAWLLAGLVRAALGRRADRLVLPLARLVRAVGPHGPPPRPPDLARLSVLRI